jgi:protein translocase SecG subunit
MIWETVLIGVHFLIAVALIGFILMQHGKGADMGAAFGSGASGSLFGAAGSANFLSRTTAILATVFFLSSLGLTYLATAGSSGACRSEFESGGNTEIAAVGGEACRDRPKPGALGLPDANRPSRALTSRRGEIGRHAVLRGQWRKPWEFESPRRHQNDKARERWTSSTLRRRCRAAAAF